MSSIGSTLNSIASALLGEINRYKSQQTQTTGTSSTTSATVVSDQVNVSQAADLFQQLKQLQTSNPAEFKQILTDAATKLKAAAGQTSNTNQADFLNNLASRFQAAATSGDLSSLQPGAQSSAATGGYSGHSHHHHGQSGGNLSSLLSSVLGNGSATTTSTQSQTASQVQSLLQGIATL